MKTTLTLAVLLALPVSRVNAASAQAKLSPTATSSKLEGVVKFTDTKAGLAVSAQVSGATPGDHGFHIHEYGDCGDQGKNAGSHFNPHNTPHGHAPHDGPRKAHVGDMGNITVGPDGRGTLETVLRGVTIASGKVTVGGRAVIFHDKADDFGQPVGNAGGRAACGPILLMPEGR